MKYRTPDLNAPRFRKKRISILTPAFFKSIREAHPHLQVLSDREIRKVLEHYNTLTWNTAISHRDGAELPENLGLIFIGACDPKSSPNPDYKTSNELEKKVEHHNLSSDSLMAKIFYTTFASKYRFRNNEIWGFEGCRKFTRSCSHEFRENFGKYIRIHKNVKISAMFSPKTEIEYCKETLVPENYNEFDL